MFRTRARSKVSRRQCTRNIQNTHRINICQNQLKSEDFGISQPSTLFRHFSEHFTGSWVLLPPKYTKKLIKKQKKTRSETSTTPATNQLTHGSSLACLSLPACLLFYSARQGAAASHQYEEQCRSPCQHEQGFRISLVQRKVSKSCVVA